jgi:hypothetical protein
MTNPTDLIPAGAIPSDDELRREAFEGAHPAAWPRPNAAAAASPKFPAVKFAEKMAEIGDRPISDEALRLQAVYRKTVGPSTGEFRSDGSNGSTPAQRELHRQALALEKNHREIERLQERLLTGGGFDPQSGEPIPLAGDVSNHISAEIAALLKNNEAIGGPGGQAKLEAAIERSLPILRKHYETAAVNEAAERYAAQMERDAKIAERAHNLLKAKGVKPPHLA